MDRFVFQFFLTIHIGNLYIELYKQQSPMWTKAIDIKVLKLSTFLKKIILIFIFLPRWFGFHNFLKKIKNINEWHKGRKQLSRNIIINSLGKIIIWEIWFWEILLWEIWMDDFFVINPARIYPFLSNGRVINIITILFHTNSIS